MQRGVIVFTKEELQIIHAFLKAELTEHPDLFQKIAPTDDDTNLIELSREEVELLLDRLAAPAPHESLEIRSSRVKLQNFLQVL